MLDWKKLLVYVTGSVDEELLPRNEYPVAENQIPRARIRGRLKLGDGERRTPAEIGKKPGRRVLEEAAMIVEPDTILVWHRKLVARKFDGSRSRRYADRPRVDEDTEHLIVRPARESRSWSYDTSRRIMRQPPRNTPVMAASLSIDVESPR